MKKRILALLMSCGNREWRTVALLLCDERHTQRKIKFMYVCVCARFHREMRSRGDCLKCIRENAMPQHESHLYDVIITRDRIVLVVLSLFRAYTVYTRTVLNDFQIQGPTGEGDNNIPYKLHSTHNIDPNWPKRNFCRFFFFSLSLLFRLVCVCAETGW